MAEQWLSIVEYARTFAVSDMTVRRRIKTGRLKAVLRDGKYYIPIGPNGEILEFSPEDPSPSLPVAPVVTKEPVPDPQDFAFRLGASFRTLPQTLSQGLQQSNQSLVDSQALLQFCDKSVSRINSIEKHLQDAYEARLQTLEAQIKLKDSVIAQLRQQAEDLQMLIVLMEQRK